MGKLRLQLLGAFRLQSAAGEPMLLPTKKSKALLALLSLSAGQLRSRSSLAALLWSESGEPQSRESLRQTLSLLRRTLLPYHAGPIISESDAIALDPSALWVDALEFAQLADSNDPDLLAEAANLYGGELLEGFDLHAPEFDRWLAAARQTYHEKAVDLFSRMLDQQLDAGNLEKASTAATKLLTLDPLRESCHRALMELYSKQGRYALALRQYQTCCDVLARELNIEPEPRTTALYREIRAQRNVHREPGSEIVRSRPDTGLPGEVRLQMTRPLERRQITVMSCELAGLDTLTGQLEPEALVGIAGEWRRQCVSVIEHFEGHMERFAGDRFTALFGFPKADEHSAEQAVRAGLALAMEVRGPQSPASGQVALRVGIATSAVVAGEFSEEKAEAALALIGRAPRIANLLQTIAPRNAVLIAGRTKQLVGDLFEFSPIPKPLFAGTLEGGPFWQVLGEARSATRFSAMHRPNKSPFVGREAELESLLDQWRIIEHGEGRIAVITGEAGIGKSRLTLELEEQLSANPHAKLFYQCSPFHTHSALYPFIRELERAADFHHADNAAVKLNKLAGLISAQGGAAPDTAPIFARLLSIPGKDSYPPLTLSPVQQRRRTFEALLDWIERFARREPVLVVFEDAHWADASSQDVLNMLADRIRSLPVLLVVTSRPEFDPPWGALGHVSHIALDRMIDRHARTLVQHLSRGDALPSAVVDQIVAKTDGIPLFVEEMTQAVLEAERASAGVAGEALKGAATQDFSIPASLQDSLMARLDRLGEAKATAQTAAVIGREFSEALLRAVAGPSAVNLEDDLQLLGSNGLIFEHVSLSGKTFAFKHALLRDIAYQTLLKGRRQQLHGAIATKICEAFPAIEQNNPEIVARHFTEAGAIVPALAYWIKAGMLALSRSANREAIAHLEHGLELVPALPQAADRRRWERQLLAVMGPAVMAVEGYAAAKSQRVFDKACELIDDDCPVAERLRIICGLWNLRSQQGELAAALPLAEEFLVLAREANLGLELGNCLMGVNLVSMGNFAPARRHLQDVVESFRLGTQTPVVIFGVDELILAHAYLARLLWSMGYPDQAAVHASKAHALTRQGANSVSVALAYVARLFLNGQNPQSGGSEKLIEDATAHAEEHELPPFKTWFAFFAAAIRLRQGHAAEALPIMEAAIADADSKQSLLFRPFQLGCVAEAYSQLGNPERALTAISDAIRTGEETGEKQSEAGLYRVKGKVLLALERSCDAEQTFQDGLTIARRQKARMEELRIAATMVSARVGDSDRNRTTLTQLYATFDEGLNSQDLRAARAALKA